MFMSAAANESVRMLLGPLLTEEEYTFYSCFYVYECFVCVDVCVCALSVCLMPTDARRGHPFPGTRVEGENRFQEVVLCPPLDYHGKCPCINTHNKCYSGF